jgi:hypothetical protein
MKTSTGDFCYTHGCVPQNFSTYWKEVKWEIMNTEHSGEEAGNGVRETAHTTL